MPLTSTEFKSRTKDFALAVIRVVDPLPRKTLSTDIISRQLIRCATSVTANYRAACRARTTPEFQAKLGIVEEEGDESAFWLEMLQDTGALPHDILAPLITEANALTAMTVASIRTSKKNSHPPR